MNSSVPATILVVEDEPRLAHLIRTILETADYRVVTVQTGEAAIEHTALDNPDLILLDLLLPGPLDGFSVANRVREFSTVPIIMVTARTQEADRLRGFETGADDYITKPFSARELLARVRAVLRRTQITSAGNSKVHIGEVIIDLAARSVTGPDGPINLTPTEGRLLMTLARNADHALTHTAILDEVWGSAYHAEIDSVRTYIRYLRKKLEPDPAHPRYLLTIPGVGYSLTTNRIGSQEQG